MTNIVTITSDWHKEDYYLSALKGSLISLPFSLELVVLTNSVPKFDVLQEIFILKSSYQFFPKGTIHLLGVMSEPSSTSPMVIFSYNNHYFVGVNDGRLSLLIKESDRIEMSSNFYVNRIFRRFYRGSNTFCALDYFTEAVSSILSNKIEETTEVISIKSEAEILPVTTNSTIVGKVIYIDSFGNAVTNITREIFYGEDRGSQFIIYVGGPSIKINRVVKNYDSWSENRYIALFNSLDLLEIAMYKGDFCMFESIDVGTEILIKFKSQK
jgi:S-adenosylmethionine hydrolase